MEKHQLPSEPSEFNEDEYEALLSSERLAEVRCGHPLTSLGLISAIFVEKALGQR